MRMPWAPPGPDRNPVRASDLVLRLAVVLGITSAITFGAIAVAGVDSSWALVAIGEALLSLTLLSRI
jgi:hypothetical protein